MGTFAIYNGKINIPEGKKDDFNRNMIKLLQLGGMVKFDEVSLYGKKTILISPVELDDKGECSFHYNYFEDDAWEDAGFDSNTNKLWSNKIGSYEFNFVICAAYILTELYSEDYGWASEDGEILNYTDYVKWINFILDKDFSMEKRFELWRYFEAYAFERMEIGYDSSEIHYKEVFNIVPKGLEEFMGGTELADILFICNGTKEIKDAPVGTYTKSVMELKSILEKFFNSNSTDGKEIIWKLITMPLDERKNINGTNYDELAIISIHMSARVFVYLSSELLNLSFWDEWQSIYNEAYTDEIEQQYVSDSIIERRKKYQTASLGKMKTSEFLRNDGYFTFFNTPEEIKYKNNYYISDDDLMYWWDGSEKVQLSGVMIKKILKWKDDFEEIKKSITEEEINEYDMMKSLMNVLNTADNYYKRIFAFNTMFYEFLENSHILNYIAAVKLLEKIVEDNKKDGCIIEYAKNSWDITSKNVTFNEGRVTVKRFLSLMANKKLRKGFFNF